MKKTYLLFLIPSLLLSVASCSNQGSESLSDTSSEMVSSAYYLSLESFDVPSNGESKVSNVYISNTDNKAFESFKENESVTVNTVKLDGVSDKTLFVGWKNKEGEIVSNETSYTFNMPNENITLTAVYNQKRNITVKVKEGQENMGSTSESCLVYHGDELEVTATTNEHYLFDRWTSLSGLEVGDSTFNYKAGASDDTLEASFREVPAKGQILKFGNYPQSEVKDEEILSFLNSLAGQIPTPFDSYNWNKFYHYRSLTETNQVATNEATYSWYIDLELGDNLYRGVYFNEYRPIWANKKADESLSLQSKRGYPIKHTYWFKYEPIEWDILNDEGLAFTNKILDITDFYHDPDRRNINDTIIFANNYQYSNIRTWLNNDFYQTAFDEIEQNDMIESLVKNDLASSMDKSNKHLCNDVNDNVFILSKADVNNEAYGLNDLSKRVCKTTDYANCMGAYLNVDTLNGRYWLRSPDTVQTYRSAMVDNNGNIIYWNDYGVAHGGVRPAITLKLN